MVNPYPGQTLNGHLRRPATNTNHFRCAEIVRARRRRIASVVSGVRSPPLKAATGQIAGMKKRAASMQPVDWFTPSRLDTFQAPDGWNITQK
jgi:hypothetical protein